MNVAPIGTAKTADSDSGNHGSNPGPSARQSRLRGYYFREKLIADIPGRTHDRG
jgi:hypothetical protein